MYKAVIFDMDGVLLDSEVTWPEIEFKRISKLIPDWTWEKHRPLTGLSIDDSYRLLRTKHDLAMSWEDYSNFYREAAKRVYYHRTNLIPGVLRLIKLLHDNKVKIGLASSSPNYWLDMVMDRFPISEYFNCILGADEVDGNGKPDPCIYLMAAEKLGLSPDECISIEDSDNGMLSAQKAGLCTMGFRNGHNEEAEFEGADIEIRGFTEKNQRRILKLVGVKVKNQAAISGN